jgi:Domain of unknown function (DUF4189)
VILLGFAIAPPISPARASCYSDCLGSCWMSSSAGSYSCTTKSGYCSAKCMSGGNDSAPSYGAIAYSASSGAYGFSEKYGNRVQAESRALSECGKGDCTVATWYFNSCGALATSGNGAWGGAQGSSERSARAQAQARCAKEGGTNCAVLFTRCSR